MQTWPLPIAMTWCVIALQWTNFQLCYACVRTIHSNTSHILMACDNCVKLNNDDKIIMRSMVNHKSNSLRAVCINYRLIFFFSFPFNI